VTLLQFILGSLDVTNQVQEIVSENEQQELVTWIYSLQHPSGKPSMRLNKHTH
jgi:hypothetical protein